MLGIIKEHKQILIDFIYSFIAYALPTIVLQFVIQPIIAEKLSANGNGLFIALFSVLKLMINVFIMPLANLRLLRKKDCEKIDTLNAYFNFLFIMATSCAVLIGSFFYAFYRELSFEIFDIIRFLIILMLMGIHDYYMTAFRLLLNYKKIVIDNCLIVAGYGIGIFIFIKTGVWEYIFICSYSFGTAYIFLNTNLWKSYPSTKCGNNLLHQYGELSASDLLKNISTYCDRLMIYPVLGGYDVSVYNAATVVSKAISVVSAPLRNVLLSYLVNHDKLSISEKKIKKILLFTISGFAAVFIVFCGFSFIVCLFLYPKYVASARPYILIVTLAILIETCGAILNIILLRFAKTKIQTIIAALKLGVYLIAVILLTVVLKIGLWGFCMAILLADIVYIVAVFVALKKYIEFAK